jgi:hypothetical protein
VVQCRPQNQLSVGFYNPWENQTDEAACIRCPPNSYTLFKQATSINQCVCSAHYFDSTQLTFMDGEIVQQLKAPMTMPEVRSDCEFHLYCSPSGSGPYTARHLAEELQRRFLPTLRWTEDPTKLPASEHMVITLNQETWTREDASETLAHEVSEAMRHGVHRLLVHEVPGARLGDNEKRNACAFDEVIADTPYHLYKSGLYNEIAQNLGGDEWRDAGLAKTAKVLTWGSGTRQQWVCKVAERRTDRTSLDESSCAEASSKGVMPLSGFKFRPTFLMNKLGLTPLTTSRTSQGMSSRFSGRTSIGGRTMRSSVGHNKPAAPRNPHQLLTKGHSFSHKSTPTPLAHPHRQLTKGHSYSHKSTKGCLSSALAQTAPSLSGVVV